MAASTHYIRTIHTSFTAAHPHSSSAWATATASAAAQYHLNHHSVNSNAPLTNQPRPHPHSHHHHPASGQPYAAQGFSQSINSHNTHMYTHHLRDLTHSAPAPLNARQQASGAALTMAEHRQYAGGARRSATTPPPPQSRRRSVSIRMPPSYKFDPFGDDPLVSSSSPTAAESAPPSVIPLTSSSQANRASASLSSSSPFVSSLAETLPAPEAEADISSAAPPSSPTHPYTIFIPAAAPSDVQRYTVSSTPARSASPGPRPLTPIQSPPQAPRSLSARAPSFTPSASRSPSPPAKSASASSRSSVAQSFTSPPANLSKIVAGMILNRVHAPKPMRRRVAPGAPAGRQYVKSCLSSVVSVEC